jgi:hypothetical protein
MKNSLELNYTCQLAGPVNKSMNWIKEYSASTPDSLPLMQTVK